MIKAKVNGVDCTIYDFYDTVAGIICLVHYPHWNIKFPVIAELVEVVIDGD